MNLVLGKLESFYHKFENGFAMILLFAMALIPVIEMVFRRLLNTGIGGSIVYVQHLTLWVGFVGSLHLNRLLPRWMSICRIWQRKFQGFSGILSAQPSVSRFFLPVFSLSEAKVLQAIWPYLPG